MENHKNPVLKTDNVSYSSHTEIAQKMPVNLDMHVPTVVKDTRVENVAPTKALPNQHALPTPILAKNLASWLQLAKYDPCKTKELIEGFNGGFTLHYDGPEESSFSKNHLSVQENFSVAQEKIQKELSKGRMAGPFLAPPFENFRISPLGIIPNKQENSFRLIQDLSYPKGNSINFFIPTEFCAVQYENLDHVVTLIKQFGHGTLIAKADVEDAFRIIPVHPKEYHLLGCKLGEYFYYDKSLPMGCSTSCQTFEKFSKSLQWILLEHFKIAGMTHILDDFIFFGPGDSSLCQYGLDSFFLLANDIQLPVKHLKTVLPTTCCIVHGIEVDTMALELRSPQDKLYKIRLILRNTSKKRTIKLKDLQSLLGLLSFACSVVVPGRAFLRRLYNLTCGIQYRHHHVTLNSQARADLQAWQIFAESFNGKHIFLQDNWTASDSIQLYSDASSVLGFAGVFGKKWFAGDWGTFFESGDITRLELFPIMLLVDIWGNLLANHCVLFFTDNEALVSIINKQSCKCPKVMKLLRHFVVQCMRYNILFRAKHVKGKHNVIADKLSRFKFQEAKRWAPWLESQGTTIPEHLSPRNWLR